MRARSIPLVCFAPLAALLAAAPARSQETESGRIVVTGVELRDDAGRVQCLLFAEDAAAVFPRVRGRAFAAAGARISGQSARCVFSDVPPGRYAVAVHHDADADGVVDTGLFGIPTEGLGASNDARGSFGPPSFDAAAFRYDGGELTLRVRVGYVF